MFFWGFYIAKVFWNNGAFPPVELFIAAVSAKCSKESRHQRWMKLVGVIELIRLIWLLVGGSHRSSFITTA